MAVMATTAEERGATATMAAMGVLAPREAWLVTTTLREMKQMMGMMMQLQLLVVSYLATRLLLQAGPAICGRA